jgi:hypothetical protein
VKLVVLVAVSPCVVIVIGPVIAPTGTLVVTCVSEFTVNGVHTANCDFCGLHEAGA